MLKLEKTSHQPGLTVRLREKEPFFDTRLLIALGIALSLHGIGLLLFHVSPFHFTSNFLFPPVQVHSNRSEPSIRVTSAYFPPEEVDLLPPPLDLKPPPLELSSISKESTLNPTVTMDLDTFQPMEEQLWPLWQMPLSLPLEEPRIHLSISGDLATYRLIRSDPLLEEKQSIYQKSAPAYVDYLVQMDEVSGTIFWYERKHSSGSEKVDKLTEKILLNLQFEAPHTLEWVSGMLNFVVLESL